MIRKYTDKFVEKQDKLKKKYAKKPPEDYSQIVKDALKLVVEKEGDEIKDGEPDYNKIHTINDGDYQGTLLFIIPIMFCE